MVPTHEYGGQQDWGRNASNMVNAPDMEADYHHYTLVPTPPRSHTEMNIIFTIPSDEHPTSSYYLTAPIDNDIVLLF